MTIASDNRLTRQLVRFTYHIASKNIRSLLLYVALLLSIRILDALCVWVVICFTVIHLVKGDFRKLSNQVLVHLFVLSEIGRDRSTLILVVGLAAVERCCQEGAIAISLLHRYDIDDVFPLCTRSFHHSLCHPTILR